MASTQQLKSRIRSVKSTKQITKAMQMVAASKMRRAQDATKGSQPYARAANELLTYLASLGATDEHRDRQVRPLHPAGRRPVRPQGSGLAVIGCAAADSPATGHRRSGGWSPRSAADRAGRAHRGHARHHARGVARRQQVVDVHEGAVEQRVPLGEDDD